MRFLLESCSPRSRNSFNRDPYFLGSFDQIAHYKGGRGGRAKSFDMSIRVPSSGGARGRLANAEAGATHRFSFIKGGPQPELHSYQFSNADSQVELSLEGEAVDLTVVRHNGSNKPIRVPSKSMPPASLLREGTSFIPFVMQDLRFLFDLKPGRSTTNLDSGKDVPSDLEQRALITIYNEFRNSSRMLSHTRSR